MLLVEPLNISFHEIHPRLFLFLEIHSSLLNEIHHSSRYFSVRADTQEIGSNFLLVSTMLKMIQLNNVF